MSNTYRYYLNQFGQDPGEAYVFPCGWSDNQLEWVAEEAAQDFHDNHDGWECRNWPIVFTVIDQQGNTHDFSVDREAVSSFSATRRHPHEPNPDRGVPQGSC